MVNSPVKKSRLKRHFLLYLGILALIASFGVGLVVGEETVRKKYLAEGAPQKQSNNVDLSVLWEVWGKLSDKFVGNLPANQEMVYGMAKGMTSSLGDPYTTFFEPEKAKQFQSDLKGSFEGIGAEIGEKQDTLTVVSPIKDSPADKAGLKPGDKIVKIDGQDTGNLELDEAVNKIRGQKDTSVKLTVVSESDPVPREIEIKRDVIDVKSVAYEMKDGNIAYIRLAGFTEDTTKEFTDVVEKVKKENPKGIILDVRNNPGGYLNTSVDIAGFFLPENSLVVREEFGEKKPANEYRTHYQPVFGNTPMVVLANEGSASASEILSGALKDDRGIKIIGKKTFGKGSVQEVIPLSDGSTVKITVAEWHTPSGISINKEGIKPDVEVDITPDDMKNQKDPQLDKAMEVIKSLESK